ncbi:hypothetical protein [Aliiroseovarius sediminis]|uniref:hypothetical protein n=1 Tax=Aliiroseovarius sediminis TaxID=2925839 RepID=UPI001F56E11A|nr:hypothetical protein [Aliiroseovarius sediminis]MCI2393688.1 hypothetical protein [Aliiroseovarius sediminis]
MKDRILKSGIVLASVLAMSACSATWEEDGIKGTQANASVQAQKTAAAPSAPKTADQIQLFADSTAGQDYTVIQDVKVAVNKTTAFNADPTIEQVKERLKASAAKLGGDAVINVVISEVKVRALSWGGRTGTGTVVKY